MTRLDLQLEDPLPKHSGMLGVMASHALKDEEEGERCQAETALRGNAQEHLLNNQ